MKLGRPQTQMPPKSTEAAGAEIDPSPETAARLPSDFERWIEVGVVLLVCAAPSLFSDWAFINHVDSLRVEIQIHTVLYRTLSSIVRDSSWIALTLFIIWKSKEAIKQFGIRPFRVVADPLTAVGIWCVICLAVRLVWLALPMIVGRENYTEIIRNRYHLDIAGPSGTSDYVLIALMSLFIGLAEELVFRAYLITRLQSLLESTPLALLLTTVIFACGHGYQGTSGIISTAIDGIVFGVAFCLFRRIWPIALAHAFFDFLVYARL